MTFDFQTPSTSNAGVDFGSGVDLSNIFSSAFTPVLAKHTKNVSLVDILAVGVDRMQRNFEPMKKQVEAWKGARLPDETAKLVIYRAFVQDELDAPKHLARRVHDQYFNPQVPEFAPRTLWSLSNAFTGAFKASIRSRSSRQPRGLPRFSKLPRQT